MNSSFRKQKGSAPAALLIAIIFTTFIGCVLLFIAEPEKTEPIESVWHFQEYCEGESPCEKPEHVLYDFALKKVNLSSDNLNGGFSASTWKSYDDLSHLFKQRYVAACVEKSNQYSLALNCPNL